MIQNQFKFTFCSLLELLYTRYWVIMASQSVLGIHLIGMRLKTALCSLFTQPILLLFEEDVKILIK